MLTRCQVSKAAESLAADVDDDLFFHFFGFIHVALVEPLKLDVVVEHHIWIVSGDYL